MQRVHAHSQGCPGKGLIVIPNIPMAPDKARNLAEFIYLSNFSQRVQLSLDRWQTSHSSLSEKNIPSPQHPDCTREGSGGALQGRRFNTSYPTVRLT